MVKLEIQKQRIAEVCFAELFVLAKKAPDLQVSTADWQCCVNFNFEIFLKYDSDSEETTFLFKS